MKVSVPKTFSKDEVAPLPLIPEVNKVDYKDQSKCSTFKLRTNPADLQGPTYSFGMAHVDGTQSIRAHLEWLNNARTVCQGLNVTDAADKVPIMKALCRGAALTSFNAKLEDNRAARYVQDQITASNAIIRNIGETEEEWLTRRKVAMDNIPLPPYNNDDIEEGLRAVVSHACPYKVLQKQKRIMRRKMRKPADMKTRLFVNHMLRIVYEELPRLPPYGPNQGFEEDELKEIIAFALPSKWTKEMTRLDHDVFVKTIDETVCFCERQEEAETEEGFTKVESKNGSHKKKSRFERPKKNSEEDKWCEYHSSKTHNTSECTTLQNLKKKGKDTDKEKFKNKTWQRKSDDAKSYTKKELHAMLKKEVAKAFKSNRNKKEVHATNKRKSDSDDDEEISVSSAGSESSNSVNVMEKRMEDCDKQLGDLALAKKPKKGKKPQKEDDESEVSV